MYYNTDDLDPKYYYAYIIDLKYINDNMTEIYIETDVFQTWQFDFTYLKSFVERKHVTDDQVGHNTIPESIATGEYILNNSQQYNNLTRSDIAYVIQFLEPYQTISSPPQATNFGGLVMRGGAYITDDPDDIGRIVQEYVDARKSTDNIYNVYCIPKFFIDYDFDNPPTDQIFTGQTDPIVDSFSISKPNNIDGYVPRNKKLLTYPYCYLSISNIQGSANILQYEKFINTSNNCTFYISGVPTPRLLYKMCT